MSGYDFDRTSKEQKTFQAVADQNVALTVARIRERSPILRDMVNEDRIGLVDAMYNIHTGKVTFM